MVRWFVVCASAVMLLAAAMLAGPSTAPVTDVSESKPRIAFFPLAGDAKEDLRNRAWQSLRLKLGRGDVYDVIDGYKMSEVAAELDGGVNLKTTVADIQSLAKLVDATVLVWGEMNNSSAGAVMRVRILDSRETEPAPRTIEKIIKEPTDLRFVSEQILELLPGVAKFEHPSEVAVQDDKQAEELWKTNPNLVKNADFSDTSGWQALYQTEKYSPPISEQVPTPDKVVIYRLPANGQTNNVLAMNLSKECAEIWGLACISDAIKIEENTRYRLSFRYKSDGPKLHVFVKGYTMEKDIRGQTVEREIYRRQVPPTADTKGQWVTIVDELNPQHVAFPVQYLKVDLYTYLHPGSVMFDDIVLKAVGKQTRKARDTAIKPPVTRE